MSHTHPPSPALSTTRKPESFDFASRSRYTQPTFGQMTPPRSPGETHVNPYQTQYDTPSDNQFGFPFVRALHTFDPSALPNSDDIDGDQDPSTICLPFEESDVALLHSVHSSGWGDATILNTGIRGWIPTNYFVAYSDAKVVPLLSSILTFVSRPNSVQLPDHSLTFSQASITSIVGGVRSLLDACSTLTRDTPIVRRSPTIRKFRKALLAELAILVSLAKQHQNSSDSHVMQRLVNTCYKIAAKSVVFLDVWVIDTNVLNHDDDEQNEDENDENEDNEVHENDVGHERSASSDTMATSDSSRRSSDAVPRPHPVAASKNRVSVLFHSKPPTARQRLDEVNEALTAYLGIFIHRMAVLESDSRSSTQILVNTRKSMLACRELLAVVEHISQTQQPRNRELELAKDRLFGQIRALVTAARDVVASSATAGPSPNSSSISPAGAKLIDIATDCSRSAGECVVRCRNMLVKLPDPGLIMPATREYPDFSDGVIAVPASRTKPRPAELSISNDDMLPHIPVMSPLIASQAPETSPSEQSFGENEKTPEADLPVQDVPLDQQIIYDARGNIKGASIEALVHHMTDETRPEDPFVISVFFLVFRSLTTPEHLGNLLIQRFAAHIDDESLPLQQLEDISSRRTKVYNLLRRWLESHWKHSTDAPVLPAIIDLADGGHFAKVVSNASTVIHDLVAKVSSGQLEDGEPLIRRTVQLPAVAEGARQTGYTQRLFQQVTPPGPLQVTKSQIMALQRANDVNGYRNDFADDSRGPSLGISNISLPGSSVSLADDARSIQSSSAWSTSLRLVRNASFVTSSDANSSSATNLAAGVLSIVDFDPSDIAAQLTVLDSLMFCRIRSDELLNKNFETNRRKLGSAPNVSRMTSFSNQLGSFVADTILVPDLTLKQRKNVLKHWIKVADRCYDLGNFNTMVAIVSVLQGVNIIRLKRVWELLSSRYDTLFRFLRDIASPNRNFSEYRNHIRYYQMMNQRSTSSKRPCVPYLGLYLSDLTFMEEGNRKSRDFGLSADGKKVKVINFDLYWRIGRVVGEIQEFQMPYRLASASKELQIWLRGEMLRAHTVMSSKGGADELWRRSLAVEPKSRQQQ